MTQDFKYFAFISYSSKDLEWGRRLQSKLESYRLPSSLCSKHGWKRKPINPVFFAPTDIQPNDLSEELQERLRQSRHLIVVCSPNSAKSKWVAKEIEFFHRLGRTKGILFFIVDGIPHSGNRDTECFNPIIDTLGLPEILAANIHEKTQTLPFTRIPSHRLNRERAYVQLISKLLGVEFDSLWQRHKRRLIQQSIAWITGGTVLGVLMFGIWKSSQAVDIQLRINEVSVHNEALDPLMDAEVCLGFENETKNVTVPSLARPAIFPNIPHRFLGKPVRVSVSCRDFLPVDTTMILTRMLQVELARDPAVYGDISFTLWNSTTESPVANTQLEIEGHTVYTDENGHASLFIPLASQRKAYDVKASVPLISKTITMPQGPSFILETF